MELFEQYIKLLNISYYGIIHDNGEWSILIY
jgi:hypothetical protein